MAHIVIMDVSIIVVPWNRYRFLETSKKFSFGSAMQSIGKEAFSDCTAITKLISHAMTPPVCDSQALDDISKWVCTLSVPKGTVSSYQQAA